MRRHWKRRRKEVNAVKKEIAEEICRTLPSKKLGPKHTRKTLAKLADEYNVIKSRKRKKDQGEKNIVEVRIKNKNTKAHVKFLT